MTSLPEFITREVGPNWCVAERKTPALQAKYDHILTSARYAALEERWAAANPDAVLRELACSRDLKLLRAAGLVVEPSRAA